MTDEETKGGCWPTPIQERLLRAILCDRDVAVEELRSLPDSVKIEQLDDGSRRLLPVLKDKLDSLGLEHPWKTELDATHRFEWMRNQVQLNQAAELIQLFAKADIRTMSLKGLALLDDYYEDAGLRPMQDVDLLVPDDKVFESKALLEENGWHCLQPHFLTKTGVKFRHSADFANEEGVRFDLHWHVLRECLETGADADFWDAAQSKMVRDTPTLSLCPADQLLHLCVHGLMWDTVPPIRWIVDAHRVISQTANLDWKRLLNQAEKRGLMLPLREALVCLSETYGAAVDSECLKKLAAHEPSETERLEYRGKTGSPEETPPRTRLWVQYKRFTVASGNAGVVARGFWFMRYLQQLWQVPAVWLVPLYVLGRAARHYWKRIFG